MTILKLKACQFLGECFFTSNKIATVIKKDNFGIVSQSLKNWVTFKQLELESIIQKYHNNEKACPKSEFGTEQANFAWFYW